MGGRVANGSRQMATSQEVVSLRDYFDSRLAAIEQTQHVSVEALDRATNLATQQLERRLDLLNEFRAQSKDEQGRYATIAGLTAIEKRLDEKIGALEQATHSLDNWRAEMEGRMYMFSVVVTVVNLLLGLGLRFVL